MTVANNNVNAKSVADEKLDQVNFDAGERAVGNLSNFASEYLGRGQPPLELVSDAWCRKCSNLVIRKMSLHGVNSENLIIGRIII